jgi:ribonuclease HII
MNQKIMTTTSLEQGFWQNGYPLVSGDDESGRGCWAGPVTAGAVILPAEPTISNDLPGVTDSKQLTAKQREMLLPLIQEFAVAWAVGWASNIEIDCLGIVPATRLAMQRAIACLAPPPQALLIDAVTLSAVPLPQQSPKFGDSISLSIAAASICAKVFRDRWMTQADRSYPGYGFAEHKGYGTRQHQAALRASGPCALHRFSFRPLRTH